MNGSVTVPSIVAARALRAGTILSCPVSEFDALRANDADLAELRSSIRAFLATDRDQHGWWPAVDCWLARWDADFSIRLAAAGFVGLTIPPSTAGAGSAICTATW